ncbi:hypothetical protein CLOM_g14194, partial [Closterium sp. NIES-68]
HRPRVPQLALLPARLLCALGLPPHHSLLLPATCRHATNRRQHRGSGASGGEGNGRRGGGGVEWGEGGWSEEERQEAALKLLKKFKGRLQSGDDDVRRKEAVLGAVGEIVACAASDHQLLFFSFILLVPSLAACSCTLSRFSLLLSCLAYSFLSSGPFIAWKTGYRLGKAGKGQQGKPAASRR